MSASSAPVCVATSINSSAEGSLLVPFPTKYTVEYLPTKLTTSEIESLPDDGYFKMVNELWGDPDLW